MVGYLSGPMSGIKDHNKPAFNTTAKVLRDKGWEIVNPAESDHLVQDVPGEKKRWHQYLRKDLAIIAQKCDAIIVLPGWEESEGAQLEVEVCFRLGMPVYKVDPVRASGTSLMMWWRARSEKTG